MPQQNVTPYVDNKEVDKNFEIINFFRDFRSKMLMVKYNYSFQHFQIIISQIIINFTLNLVYVIRVQLLDNYFIEVNFQDRLNSYSFVTLFDILLLRNFRDWR